MFHYVIPLDHAGFDGTLPSSRILSLAGTLLMAYSASAGSWMMLNLVAPPLNNFLQFVATLFDLSAAVHGILILPVMLSLICNYALIFNIVSHLTQIW